MFQEGSIFLISNNILSTNDFRLHGMKQLDHAKKRPAVVIGEDDEWFYYLTMSSKPGPFVFSYETDEYILPNGKVMELDYPRTQYVETKNIYRHRIYGLIDVSAMPSDKYLELLKSLKEYQTSDINIDKSDWNNISQIVDRQIENMQRKK